LNTEIFESNGQKTDIYQKLLDSRILFLSDSITEQNAVDLVANILLKDSESNEKITIFINSTGGNIRDALMIHDMIRIAKSPIETICVGQASNEAAMLLSSGTPGMRFITKNAIMTISQLECSWTSFGDLNDAKKIFDNVSDANKRMMEIIAKTTGKTIKQVVSDFDRPVFMNSSQALKYKLVDKIIDLKQVKNAQ
jgi:ATP-dependent Clp protease protease subunit